MFYLQMLQQPDPSVCLSENPLQEVRFRAGANLCLRVDHRFLSLKLE